MEPLPSQKIGENKLQQHNILQNRIRKRSNRQETLVLPIYSKLFISLDFPLVDSIINPFAIKCGAQIKNLSLFYCFLLEGER